MIFISVTGMIWLPGLYHSPECRTNDSGNGVAEKQYGRRFGGRANLSDGPWHWQNCQRYAIIWLFSGQLSPVIEIDLNSEAVHE
jgi:hypothetical protein